MDDRLVVSLLRHGSTLENERHAYIGWTDVPLSAMGKAELLKSEITVNKTCEVVFSSPLKRCLETAKILFPGSPIVQVDSLKELHFGAWEGKTYEQLKENKNYRRWLTNTFAHPIEQGETYEQFRRRIMRGLQFVLNETLSKHYGQIAVVSHGGVLRLIFHTLFPETGSFFDWHIPLGGGYELIWDKNELRRDRSECTLLAVEPIMARQIG